MWFWRTIGGRIVLFLMLALTPVGLIAVIQTREVEIGRASCRERV